MRVAPTDTTVFLQGESGTGKKVVVRFIHQASPRKDGPFVAINCAALPEQLLESGLFGYERGAFTGAQQAKAGQIELAARGVLFLDEVSEMSPSAQAEFSAVLQEREFQRLGATRLQKANVRVIAASNRYLRQVVEQGKNISSRWQQNGYSRSRSSELDASTDVDGQSPTRCRLRFHHDDRDTDRRLRWGGNKPTARAAGG
jgi:DNA-binding NtrC family response regulator